MAMNYELDRHIYANRSAGLIQGVDILKSYKVLFNSAKDAGLVQELPMELRTPLNPEEIMQRVATITVGEAVKKWREFRGLSSTEFVQRASSEEFRLSKQYLSQLEKGKIINPPTEKLEQIAAPLGISAWDLYTRFLPSDLKNDSEQQIKSAERKVRDYQRIGKTTDGRQFGEYIDENNQTRYEIVPEGILAIAPWEYIDEISPDDPRFDRPEQSQK